MAKRDMMFESHLINFRLEQQHNDQPISQPPPQQMPDSESFLQSLGPIDGVNHMPHSSHAHPTLTAVHRPPHQDDLHRRHILLRDNDNAEDDGIVDFRMKESYWGVEESKLLNSLVTRHYIPWTNRKVKPKPIQHGSTCICIKYTQVNQVWEHISTMLKEEGFQRTARQCQVKWQNMKERSKKRKTEENGYGQDAFLATQSHEGIHSDEQRYDFPNTDGNGDPFKPDGTGGFKRLKEDEPHEHGYDQDEADAILSGIDSINQSLYGLRNAIQKHAAQMTEFIGSMSRMVHALEQHKEYSQSPEGGSMYHHSSN